MDFPLDLRFKHFALSHQIYVRDARGLLLCYVRQKAFKLKEDVVVYADEAQTRPLYRIRSDRVLDISAQYTISDESGGADLPKGAVLGTVRRRGMRSLWRAQYEVERAGEPGRPAFTIQEERPWVKVADALLGELPLVGIFSGYLFHPSYLVLRGAGRVGAGDPALRLRKLPALLEGHFELEALGALTDAEARLAFLSVIMMVLLERRRG